MGSAEVRLEGNTIHWTSHGVQTPEQARGSTEFALALLDEAGIESAFMLVDVSDSETIDVKTRGVYVNFCRDPRWSAVAVFGARRTMRLMAALVLKVARVGNIQMVATRREAWAWLVGQGALAQAA